MIAPKSSLKSLTPYVPGRSLESVYQEKGIHAIKLASNESLWGPSPRAIESAKQSLDQLATYPEAHFAPLYELLGSLHGFSADHIIAGNGADELLQVIALTYASPGDEVIYPVPSFSAYRHGTLLTGANPVEVGLNSEGAPNLQEVQAKITPKTRLIFLCSPNNPTGGILHQEEWQSFLRTLPESVLVVVDQAYYEFVEDPSYAELTQDILADRPVIMVRTLSKIYGLAALRIGWAAGPVSLISVLRTMRPPFSVSRTASAAAEAALLDQHYIARVREATLEAREYMMSEFRRRGYRFWPSQANFVTIELESEAQAVAEKLEAEGYVTRPAANFGLPRHLRVTVAPIPVLEGFFRALDHISGMTR
ncbi:MAG: histidinol-phosphate transaminase [Firmicutes bacterium]|nr:histidinol-phosphate transaminase [Bacillota bacterium]MCL5012540.1 histidinol-phosphate transaminase [Bacillota bacterium]